MAGKKKLNYLVWIPLDSQVCIINILPTEGGENVRTSSIFHKNIDELESTVIH